VVQCAEGLGVSFVSLFYTTPYYLIYRPCSWNQSGAQSDSQRMNGFAGSYDHLLSPGSL
jgi:hypothetical protein